MSDKIVVMKDGVIQQVDTPKNIYDEPKNVFVANFIGDSNVLSGVMNSDYKISFAGKQFTCVDKGFRKNEPVDVLIRPEDVVVGKPETGMLEGEVLSAIFKGIHYELSVMCGKIEFLVQTTKEWEAGDKVSLTVSPNSMHIMKKLTSANFYDGVIRSFSKVEFAGTEWECDFHKLFKGGYTIDPENETVKDNKGEEVDYKGLEVDVEFGLNAITLTDNEDDGNIGGKIIYKFFKGDHYNYVVRTNEGYDFMLDSNDNWDDKDRVGIQVKPLYIEMSLSIDEETDN